MASKLECINIALGKLGNTKTVASLTEDTAERIAATTVWDYIRDLVLGERAWYFARTRARLHRIDVVPKFEYDYAYVQPDDFIRLINPKPDMPSIYPSYGTTYDWIMESIQIPDGLEKLDNGGFGTDTVWTKGAQWTISGGVAVKVAGGVSTLSQIVGSMISAPVADEIYLVEFDVDDVSGGSILPSIGGTNGTPVSQDGTDVQQYIQAINATDGLVFYPSASGMACKIDNASVLKVLDKLALLIDYEDSNSYPLYEGYIRRVIDTARWPMAFVDAFTFRLAAEMAFKLTEGTAKYQAMMTLYDKALVRADELGQTMESQGDETGNSDWENAGR